MSDTDDPQSEAASDLPYGARFIKAFREIGGISSTFLRYESIAEIKKADREGTIALLRKHHPFIEYSTLQVLRQHDAEIAALVLSRTVIL